MCVLQCSKTCGSGVRVREVRCYQGEEIGHSCDSTLKPQARQSCEVQACPTEAPGNTHATRNNTQLPREHSITVYGSTHKILIESNKKTPFSNNGFMLMNVVCICTSYVSYCACMKVKTSSLRVLFFHGMPKVTCVSLVHKKFNRDSKQISLFTCTFVVYNVVDLSNYKVKIRQQSEPFRQ